MNPTLILAVGELGAQVAARFAAEPLPAYLCVQRLAADADAPTTAALFEELSQTLKSLLRKSAAGQLGGASLEGGGSGSRLDLLLIADVAELSPGRLVDTAQRLSALLLRDFAVIFPPHLSPEQRGVGLIALLATPALDGSGSGRAAMAAVRALEGWHLKGAPSPILNRIYLLPQQTETMPLSVEDRERIAAQFLQACYVSGVRDSDAIRARLGPPRQPGALISSLSVATADVDVATLRKAYAWRSALAGLSTLIEHCERPSARERAMAVADDLQLEAWCQPLVELERHPDAGATGAAHDRWLQLLDRAETEAVRLMRASLDKLLGEQLTGNDGLRGYHLVKSSLAMASERLLATEQALASAFAPVPVAETPAPMPTPAAAPVTPAASPAATGSLGRVLSLSVLTAGSLAALAMLLTSSLLSRSMAGAPAAGPVISGPVPADLTAVWVGVAVFVVAAAGCSALLWPRAATPAEPSVSDDSAGRAERRQASQRTKSDLVIRRRRVARAARQTLLAVLDRLSALRAALIDGRDRAREELRQLGVKAGEPPASDDYRELLEREAPLHRALLLADALPGLWERSQALRDPEIWASELLKRAWPAKWLNEDLPFGAGGSWEAELDAQHRLLRENGVFSWPEVGAALNESLREFLSSVPRALSFGVRGRQPDGTPTSLPESHQTLLLVPADGRGLVERLLRDQPLVGALLLPCGGITSRVLLLRTTGELELASLERGAS